MLNPIHSISVKVPDARVVHLSCAARAPAENRSELVKQLFRENNRALVHFLAAKLGSAGDAQEVAQEAYVRVLELDRPDTISFLRAYLFRTAANIATDRLRQRSVRSRNAARQTVLFEELLTRPSPERVAIGEQQLAIIKKALLQLPDKCREACALHFFAECSIRDIADHMHLSERMIRYYIARGLAQCAARLDPPAEAGDST